MFFLNTCKSPQTGVGNCAVNILFMAKHVACLDRLGTVVSAAHTPNETVDLKPLTY